MKILIRLLGFLLGAAVLLFSAVVFSKRTNWVTALALFFFGIYLIFYAITGYGEFLGAKGYLRRKKQGGK